jgi:hypothetical protein
MRSASPTATRRLTSGCDSRAGKSPAEKSPGVDHNWRRLHHKRSDGTREHKDLPSSWGTPSVRLPCSVEAGRTARTRPLRCSSTAPGIRTAKAPAKGLSALNSMAFGLAVHASQCGLPTPHARLASSRWSDSTGRACHPQGSDERFRSVSYISSSSPKLAWRNLIDRSRLSDR